MSDVQFPAEPGGCEEAVILFPEQTKAFSCNKPATNFVGWPRRGEGPYRMCEMCTDHSVRNRGATDLGPFVEGETPSMEANG